MKRNGSAKERRWKRTRGKVRRGRRSNAGTGPEDNNTDLVHTRQERFPHRPHRHFRITAPCSFPCCGAEEGGRCRDRPSWRVGRRGAVMHSVCFSVGRGGARVPSSRCSPTRRHGKSNLGWTSQNGSIKGQSRRNMPCRRTGRAHWPCSRGGFPAVMGCSEYHGRGPSSC